MLQRWKSISADKGVISGFMNVSFSSARGAADSSGCVWVLCASPWYMFRNWEMNYNRRTCKFSPSCGSIGMRCGSSCSLLLSLFVISLMGISNSHFAEVVRRHSVAINPVLHENLLWWEQMYVPIGLRRSLFIIFTFLPSFLTAIIWKLLSLLSNGYRGLVPQR